VAAWMLHATAMWFWHARIPYEAPLRSEAIHVLQHASYFLTGLLFWSVVVRTVRSEATGWGLGLLMIFAMTSQTTILAALMTFARTPWYRPYAETTGTWGIGHLADQQLAAVIMWIPSGMLYLAAGIGLMATWMRNAAAEQRGSNRVAGPT
jgi:putative membrane protein